MGIVNNIFNMKRIYCMETKYMNNVKYIVVKFKQSLEVFLVCDYKKKKNWKRLNGITGEGRWEIHHTWNTKGCGGHQPLFTYYNQNLHHSLSLLSLPSTHLPQSQRHLTPSPLHSNSNYLTIWLQNKYNLLFTLIRLTKFILSHFFFYFFFLSPSHLTKYTSSEKSPFHFLNLSFIFLK